MRVMSCYVATVFDVLTRSFFNYFCGLWWIGCEEWATSLSNSLVLGSEKWMNYMWWVRKILQLWQYESKQLNSKIIIPAVNIHYCHKGKLPALLCQVLTLVFFIHSNAHTHSGAAMQRHLLPIRAYSVRKSSVFYLNPSVFEETIDQTASLVNSLLHKLRNSGLVTSMLKLLIELGKALTHHCCIIHFLFCATV